MKFTFFVALASVLVAAQAVTIADRSAASTECFTTHTGYLVEDKDFGINSENLIVWPYNATNPKIKLSLQVTLPISASIHFANHVTGLPTTESKVWRVRISDPVLW